MLVQRKALVHAVQDVTGRNALIRKLRSTPANHQAYFHAHVLAYWLGDNTIRLVLPLHYARKLDFLNALYFIFLLLDKLVTGSPDKSSAEYAAYKDCQVRLFCYANKHYRRLTTDKPRFIDDVENILREYQLIPASDEQNQMDHPVNGAFTKLIKLAKKSADDEVLFHDICHLRLNNRLTNLFIQSTKIISSFNLYTRFPGNSMTNNVDQFYIQKLLLPAADGTILDGLYIRPSTGSKKAMVLVQLGHFQAEHSYISFHATRLNELFATDMVFLNHRNYSSRSMLLADSAHQLASDITTFAEFAAKSGKEIVLYGMCGGAAPMLLAAKRLDQKRMPYKLILDRFSGRYHDFLDHKTVVSHFESYTKMNVLHARTNWFERLISYKHGVTLLLPLIFLLTFLLRLVISVVQQECDFAALVKTVNPHHLLILEAKGKKPAGTFLTLQTDIFVHPENNLRHAVREMRLQNKNSLRRLRDLSEEIAAYCRYCKNDEARQLTYVFERMAFGLTACLQLISSEKLFSYYSSNPVQCLHSDLLHQLATRENIPVGKFLQGFFNTPAVRSKKLLQKLAASTIQMSSYTYNMRENDTYGSFSFQCLIKAFLTEIAASIPYLSHMFDRANATGLCDITPTLQALLATPLLTPPTAVNMSYRAN